MLRQTQALLWRLDAVTAVGVGLLGVAVPGLPTVPFLLVGAWAASKGWPALERWLLEHRTYSPHLRNWRERGAVPRRAKVLATAMMVASVIVLLFTPAPAWLRITAPLALLAVAVWLWTPASRTAARTPVITRTMPPSGAAGGRAPPRFAPALTW